MLGLSVIILFKSLLHVFCSLVFSAHNSSGLEVHLLVNDPMLRSQPYDQNCDANAVSYFYNVFIQCPIFLFFIQWLMFAAKLITFAFWVFHRLMPRINFISTLASNPARTFPVLVGNNRVYSRCGC